MLADEKDRHWLAAAEQQLERRPQLERNRILDEVSLVEEHVHRHGARVRIDAIQHVHWHLGAGGEAFNEYAWALVSTEVEEVRNPALALRYATRAVEKAGSPKPVYLHTLGWAHYRLGNRSEAIRTLERALQSLPAAASGPAVGLRRQVEADLTAFKASE